MNTPDANEVSLKVEKVRSLLTAEGYDAMIIARQDNFAWITDGGNNRVIVPSEYGFSVIVITGSNKYLISQLSDGARVMEEELSGLDFEYVPLHWYDSPREKKAMELVKGGRVIADTPVCGADYLPGEIYRLQYPMTEREMNRFRWLGEKTEEIIARVAGELKPGMTEHEIEAMFLFEYGKCNIYPDVLLVGSDERIFRYRHPNPSDKKVERYVLLHPAVRKWGLHANVTRLLYFGDSLPEEIRRKYDAASTIEAACISMCEPGNRFSDILSEQKKLYKDFGFEDEWRYHYQGGITGYMVGDATVSGDPANVVQPNQAYDWFITITGVKTEELSINTAKGQEVVSVTGRWPVREVSYNGKSFKLPEILMK